MWTAAEKKKFNAMLIQTAELFSKKLTPSAIGLFIRIMSAQASYSEALTVFLSNGSANSSFFPKPADLIRLISGTPEDQCERAWHDVLNTLARVGVWQSVTFRDPIINSVLTDMGGWPTLGGKTEDEMRFVSHEFRRLYRLCQQSGQIKKITHLPGEAECCNLSHGFGENTEPPLLVGSEPPKLPCGRGDQASEILTVGKTEEIRKLASVIGG